MSARRRARAAAAVPRRSVLVYAQRGLLLAGAVAVVVGCSMLGAEGGRASLSRALGELGLAALVLAFAAPTLASLRAGSTAARLPRAVGRTQLVSTRALRIRMAITVALAVGLPVAVAVAAMALSSTGWVWLVLALGFGGAGVAIDRSARRKPRQERADSWPEVGVALERLCMLADLPVPPVSIERDRVATAFTSAGALRLTTGLIESLDERELEAVIAHEIAHLAHRDAAVMDVVTMPSRILLGMVSTGLHPGRLKPEPSLPQKASLMIWGVVFVPVGFVLGWASRLLVLGLSRARELAADAAAATLTGRPSALASALLKLEPSQRRAPRTDLRAIEALCIVEVGASRGWGPLRTHPPVGLRVERLEAMEERLQAR